MLIFLTYLSHNTSIYLVYSEHTELKEDVKNKVICIATYVYVLRSIFICHFSNFEVSKNYPLAIIIFGMLYY